MSDHTPVDPDPWAGTTLCELSIRSKWLGTNMINVHHFAAETGKENTFGPSNTDTRILWCSDVIEAYRTQVLPTLTAIHTSSYETTELRCQVLEMPGRLMARLQPVSVAINLSGSSQGDPGSNLQAYNAIVIRWKSDFASRTARGRTYFGGFTTSQISGTQVTTSGVSFGDSYAAVMKLAFGAASNNAAGAMHVVYSRPYRIMEWTSSDAGRLIVHHKVGYAGATFRVLSHSVDPNARVQRRREVGVGL